MVSKLFAALTACSFLLFALPAEARQLVVIQSTDTTVKSGSIVDSDRITVTNGAQVILLDPSGTSFSILGPYDGPLLQKNSGVPPSDGSVITALNRLIADNATTTSSLGVVRATENDIQLSIGEISAEHSGPQCVRAGDPITIRRADPNRRETAKLKMLGGRRKSFAWADGDVSIAWPETVPVEDGVIYLLRRVKGGLPLKIQLHVLTDTAAHDAYFGAWAGAIGCKLQADAAIRALSSK